LKPGWTPFAQAQKSGQQDRGTPCFTASRFATDMEKVNSGFALAELDLDRRLKDETSYQQKLRKLQIAMLELEEILPIASSDGAASSRSRAGMLQARAAQSSD
jgi:hypothetical protein